MAKDKTSSKAAASAVASKPFDSVKAGRVTKPAKSSKAVPESKRKVERESSPESNSSSDESDGTSASSASSDDGSDSEQEVDTKVDKEMKDDSDSDSDSSDSEKETVAKKVEAPKVNGTAKADSGAKEAAPKINGKAKASSDDEDDSAESDSSSGSSDSGSDSDSDSDSESEAGSEKDADTKAGAEKAADDSSSASSSDDEDEAPPVKVEEPAKKRKAEAPVEQTPKKARVNTSERQTGQVANLFVGNLSWNVDEEWLTREFEEFGELKGVRVITDRDSGRSKGYGYVEFKEVECAVQALEAKHESLLDGRNIRIDYSTPRPQKNNDGFTPKERSFDRAQRYGDTQKPPTKTLFVGNVSFSADENMLTELFQDYGTIAAVRLPTDRETGELKGFGYVEFTSIDESKAALEALNGSPIEGRPIRLDFAGERSNDSPRGGGGFNRGAPRGRGGFSDRGGRGGFNDRGRGRGGARGGRGGTTNRGGFGDFSGKKISF